MMKIDEIIERKMERSELPCNWRPEYLDVECYVIYNTPDWMLCTYKTSEGVFTGEWRRFSGVRHISKATKEEEKFLLNP